MISNNHRPGRLLFGGPIIAAQSPTIGEAGHPVTYYEPDEHDRMEVVAECGKHYVMQPRADLFAGIAAPCDKTNERGFCMGPRVL